MTMIPNVSVLNRKKVLVLGGYGMVGRAICRLLLDRGPAEIIVHSQWEQDALATAEYLRKIRDEQTGSAGATPKVIPCHGDVFVRESFKDRPQSELLADAETRAGLIEDLLEDVTRQNADRGALWRLFEKHRPNIVIDCINTATVLAYGNVHKEMQSVYNAVSDSTILREELKERLELLLYSLPVPRLVKHMQELNQAVRDFKTEIYVKIGTTGTGGMGINIPYTHGEVKPSKQLMGKTAMAGAHSLLLYLLYASPDPPITREIKPSAAIAWKDIQFGQVRQGRRVIELVDCPCPLGCERGDHLERVLDGEEVETVVDDEGEPETLQAVYIDTGENGMFSLEEFQAITTQRQMEFITPEEIAATVVDEISGRSTGHDVLSAIRTSSMGPSYRAGFLRDVAIRRARDLVRKHAKDGVAFEFLGPPKLSKWLFEAYLLKKAFSTLGNVVKSEPKTLVERCLDLIENDRDLRAHILSIGLPILLPDGKRYLRGRSICHPDFGVEARLPIEQEEQVGQWAVEGWVDLREVNLSWWRSQLLELVREIESIPETDQHAATSFHTRTNVFWGATEDKSKLHELELDIGEIVGWLFVRLEGARPGHED